MTIEFEEVSEVGPVREHNEDFIGHLCPNEASHAEKGCLFAIADGVGGSLAGEVASREAVTTLLDSFAKSDAGSRPDRALKTAFETANLRVYDMGMQAQYRRMKTTLAAVLLKGTDAHIGHIGDTRVYLIRDQKIRQLTRDHSEVGELVRLGIISEAEARHHPRRNIIMRSLGSELILQADFRVEKVLPHDALLLCTDGVWEPIEDDEMASIVTALEPAPACQKLIALAIERGSSDNLSVQVVRIVATDESASNEPRRGLLGRLFGR